MDRVALVTTSGIDCGIAEFGAYWHEAVTWAALPLRLEVVSDLHPNAILNNYKLPPVIVLNYQAALLSQWHPEHIRDAQRQGSKVLVIYHDSGVPNSDQCKAICEASDYFVLHEPFDDLPPNGEFMRQGIPSYQEPYILSANRAYESAFIAYKRWCNQPVIGTVGFPSGYKNYDLLCEASALAGWATLLIAPNASDEQIAVWLKRQPALWVERNFMDRREVIARLAGCDATAFLYVTNNNGTSGAIRQGIAARKPVLAFRSRQFRDLEDEQAIRWIDDGSLQGVARALETTPSVRCDHGIVRLAEQDSWARKGIRYAEIINRLLS